MVFKIGAVTILISSDRPVEFRDFLQVSGITKVLLAPFKDNRFSIPSSNGSGVSYLQQHLSIVGLCPSMQMTINRLFAAINRSWQFYFLCRCSGPCTCIPFGDDHWSGRSCSWDGSQIPAAAPPLPDMGWGCNYSSHRWNSPVWWYSDHQRPYLHRTDRDQSIPLVRRTH